MSVIDRTAAIYSWASKLRQIGRVHVSRIVGSAGADNGAYKTLLSFVERSLFMRAELNAMTALFLEKKLFTEAEWTKQLEEEHRHLFTEFAKEWHELEFDEHSFTIKNKAAFAERIKREGWPP